MRLLSFFRRNMSPLRYYCYILFFRFRLLLFQKSRCYFRPGLRCLCLVYLRHLRLLLFRLFYRQRLFYSSEFRFYLYLLFLTGRYFGLFFQILLFLLRGMLFRKNRYYFTSGSGLRFPVFLRYRFRLLFRLFYPRLLLYIGVPLRHLLLLFRRSILYLLFY